MSNEILFCRFGGWSLPFTKSFSIEVKAFIITYIIIKAVMVAILLQQGTFDLSMYCECYVYYVYIIMLVTVLNLLHSIYYITSSCFQKLQNYNLCVYYIIRSVHIIIYYIFAMYVFAKLFMQVYMYYVHISV